MSTHDKLGNSIERKSHTDMTEILLELFHDRDKKFIRDFCQEGAYLDEKGETVHGVCRTMSAAEFLTFMHQQDAKLLEAIKTIYGDQD